MSPKQFSSAVVTARLVLMKELLDDLDTIGAVDVERLQRDRITRRALERVLTQLIDLAADINAHVGASIGGTPATEYREGFDLAVRVGLISRALAEELKPSVGLRNVLVHEYAHIDLERVVNVVPLARDGYGDYVRAVAGWLSDRA